MLQWLRYLLLRQAFAKMVLRRLAVLVPVDPSAHLRGWVPALFKVSIGAHCRAGREHASLL